MIAELHVRLQDRVHPTDLTQELEPLRENIDQYESGSECREVRIGSLIEKDETVYGGHVRRRYRVRSAAII